MNASSINRLARFLEGYGLAECPIVECASNLTKRRGKFDARLRLVERVVDLETAVKFVSTLTVPDSRHVAVAAANWTVFINNARNGSDYHNYTRSFPLYLDARFARIVSRPGKTWNNNAIRLKLQYAATIFELYDRRGDSIRSVCCMDDGGRWTFDEGGDPHPVEATFPYQNKKKRERFTSKELARLAASFGLPEVTTETFENAESFYLFECDVHIISTCSITDAQDPAFGYYERGLGWVKYLNTHASSVIADFERCLQINPNYEPKVRPFLNQAYHIVSQQGQA